MERFKSWVAQFVTSHGNKISVIRSDNGTEIINYKFEELLTSISARHLIPLAERANRSIIQLTNTLRLTGSFLKRRERMFPANIAHALPCPRMCKSNPECASPFEMIAGAAPDVSFIRVMYTRFKTAPR